MLSNVATGPDLPKENPRPTEGIPGRSHPMPDQLSNGEVVNKEECERVPSFKWFLRDVATSGGGDPVALDAFTHNWGMPNHIMLLAALMYHRPYFWARRKIAIPLPTGTLYAAFNGWRFEPSAFLKN